MPPLLRPHPSPPPPSGTPAWCRTQRTRRGATRTATATAWRHRELQAAVRRAGHSPGGMLLDASIASSRRWTSSSPTRRGHARPCSWRAKWCAANSSRARRWWLAWRRSARRGDALGQAHHRAGASAGGPAAFIAAGAEETLAARGARLIADTAVERGGVRIDSDVGHVDAAIARRWEQAAAGIAADGAGAAGPAGHGGRAGDQGGDEPAAQGPDA
ncbi:MAG: FliH/SctL family protein [Rubrivivax sp.]